MPYIAKLTSKSQITIPAEVRRQLGIGPGDRVVLDIEHGFAVLRPIGGSFTERMEGMGRDLWVTDGGGRRWLDQERDDWDR